jgi:hypothetical protein
LVEHDLFRNRHPLFGIVLQRPGETPRQLGNLVA